MILPPATDTQLSDNIVTEVYHEQFSKTKSKSRKPYSEEYKAEALKLANALGVSAAAKELGLHNSQIYASRSKSQRDESTSDAESRLLDENIALKRQLAESKQELDFLKKASAYFAKNQK